MSKKKESRKREPVTAPVTSAEVTKVLQDCGHGSVVEPDTYTTLLSYAYQKVLEAYSLEARSYAIENLEATMPRELRAPYVTAYQKSLAEMAEATGGHPDTMTDSLILSVKFNVLSEHVLTWLSVFGTGFSSFGLRLE